MQKIEHTQLTKHFEVNFHWNLWLSICYEVLRVIHNVMLVKILPQATYGLIGTIFATMYLIAKCADLGTAYTISPFFMTYTQTRARLKTFILSYSLFPLLLSLTTLLAFFFWYASRNFQLLSLSTPLLLVLASIIILETLRSNSRQLLHVAFKSQPVMLTEFILFISYLLIIWGSYFWLNLLPSINLIFGLFLLDSFLALLFFGNKIHQLYTSLPITTILDQQPPSFPAIIRLRLSNFVLRISKDLFTTNVLTPLFAITLGLKSAGIFYVLSTIVMAIQTIIKATVGHAGSALLAHVKQQSIIIKREAFKLISSKFLMIIIALTIILGGNLGFLINFYKLNDVSSITLVCIAIYLLIALSDLFIMLYEYFYLLETSINLLCFMKIIEAGIFYFMITKHYGSPMTILTSIITIRSITLLITIGYAYKKWHITPYVKLSLKYIGGCVTTLLVIKLLISLIK